MTVRNFYVSREALEVSFCGNYLIVAGVSLRFQLSTISNFVKVAAPQNSDSFPKLLHNLNAAIAGMHISIILLARNLRRPRWGYPVMGSCKRYFGFCRFTKYTNRIYQRDNCS